MAARAFRIVGRVAIAVALAMGAHAAQAAALGSVASSLGLIGALAVLVVVKALSTHLAPASASTAFAAVAVAGGAAWLWRSRPAWRGSQVLAHAPGRRLMPEAPAALVELPDGLDRESLLAELRVHFVRLQDAWDRGDDEQLRALAMPEMLDELRLGLPESACSASVGRTEVVSVSVELLGFERLSHDLLVSAAFSGLLRESTGGPTVPFKEVWLLTKPDQRAGVWRLARHQALF